MERGLAIGTVGFSLCGNAAITSRQCLRELSSKQIVTTVSLDIMRNLATSRRGKGGEPIRVIILCNLIALSFRG
jgi:hypothetical protein